MKTVSFYIIILLVNIFTAKNLFTQDQAISTDTILNDILNIYKTDGERGLKNYIKDHINEINPKAITKLAESGQKLRDSLRLNAALLLAEKKGDKKTSADVFLNYGTYCYFTGKCNDSENLVKSLQIYKEIKDTLGQGNSTLILGKYYLFHSQFNKALELFSIALTCFQAVNDSNGQAYVYTYQGDYYERMNKLDESVEFYNRALEIFKLTNDTDGEGKACFKIGVALMYQSKFSKALEQFIHAEHFYLITNNNSGLGDVYLFSGDIYYDQDDYETAISNYKKAAAAYEKAGEPFGLGGVFMGLGNCYRLKNNHKKALEMFDKALQYYEAIDEPMSMGNIYMNMGDLYFTESNLIKSNEMYYKALSFYEKAEDSRGQANILHSLANTFNDIGNYDKASELYYKALPIYESLQDFLGLGNTYHCLGKLYLNKQEYPNAMKMELKALPYFEKADSPLSLGNDYFQLGDIYLKLNNPDSALCMYLKAEENFNKAGNLLGQGNVYKSRGEVYQSKNEYSKAIEEFDKALEKYNIANTPEMQAKVMFLKADLYLLNNKKDSSYSFYKKGVSILEKLRTNMGLAEMKISYFEKMMELYESAALFMLENNKKDEVFSYIESMKARGFLDQIIEKKTGNFEKGLSPDLKEKRDSLIARLSSLKVSIAYAEAENSDILVSEYNKAEDDYNRAIQEIRLKNPSYAMIEYPDIIDVEKLKKILKPDEVLLEYFLSNKGVYAFVITDESYNVIKLPDSLKSIEDECNTFIKSLTSQKYISVENKLFNMIIKPIEQYFEKKHNLIIVPEGILTSLPFEAMIDDINNEGKPEYLIEKYSIKYFQSAALLVFGREHKTTAEPIDNSFAGFGDPVYDYENYAKGEPEKGERIKFGVDSQYVSLKGDNYRSVGGIYNRLEGSGEEVKEISGLFEKKKVYSRIDATEENLKKNELKFYSYILLSCHGILNDEFQSMVLSLIPGSKEDGYLTIDEIMNLEWNADMVVLSACQSGKGKVKRGEGVIGLTRAVMYAGTHAAVVSLWNVDEKGTKELMLNLFKNIKEKGLSKEEAFRNAKLEMLKSKYDNPFYWSAFIMYGE